MAEMQPRSTPPGSCSPGTEARTPLHHCLPQPSPHLLGTDSLPALLQVSFNSAIHKHLAAPCRQLSLSGSPSTLLLKGLMECYNIFLRLFFFFFVMLCKCSHLIPLYCCDLQMSCALSVCLRMFFFGYPGRGKNWRGVNLQSSSACSGWSRTLGTDSVQNRAQRVDVSFSTHLCHSIFEERGRGGHTQKRIFLQKSEKCISL